MRDIQVIAVDMDGTFLHSDDSYDRQRFAQLRSRMDSAGVRFVVASGNQYEQLRSFFPEPERISFVADNGALVVSAGEVLFSARIAPEAVARIAALFNSDRMPYLACGPDGAFAPDWVSDDYLREMGRYYHRLARISAIAPEQQIYKFGLVDERGLPPDLPERLAAAVGDAIVPVVSGHGSMDLGAPGVNKGTGLKLLLDRWGIQPAHLAAFGDSANDLEMLALAGHPVAMANASEPVLAAVPARTDTNDDDGVLNQLERWLGA